MFQHLSIPIPQKKYSPKFIQELQPKNFLSVGSKPLLSTEEPEAFVDFQHFSSLLGLFKLKQLKIEGRDDCPQEKIEVPQYDPRKSYEYLANILAVQAEANLEEIKNLSLKLELSRDFFARKVASQTQETDTISVQKRRLRRKKEELNYPFKVRIFH